MFGHKLGLHVIKFPSGRWGFVGSIPAALGEEVPASRSAILGCRTHTGHDGRPMEWKFPSFDTEEAAVSFAASRGHEAR